MYLTYPSRALEEAVNEFSKLPGIGSKTALRMVLHLLRQDHESLEHFGNAVLKLTTDIRYCRICNNISDQDICPVCADTHRDSSVICVVENVKDVMIIENTHQYNGLYHVLGGIISPMDGIGPSDLNIDSLEKRAQKEINEVILALSATMEGDTTNFYLYKKLKKFVPVISTLARGVSVGDELEFIDEATLARSLKNRVPFS
jgi:recombination protein RecR